jgi:NADPH:quinone reductase
MNKELRSLLNEEGVLELSVKSSDIPTPKAGEVVVQIEAAPINPSDVAVLFGMSNLITPDLTGTTAKPKSIKYPPALLGHFIKRIGKSLPSGNEGAGIVIDAGEGAEHLKGKVVALFGANSFAKYRCIPAQACIVMNEGTTPIDAAASCVNPYTVLAMVETMKMENHHAIINTAAASNLGQMLVKVCKADGIPLINIVRRQEQVDLLKSIGAKYVLNSSEDNFKADLIAAIKETGATLAFECIGGGTMTNDLLDAMEKAIQSQNETYSVYGSTTMKQVYMYGSLSQQPTILNRSYGMYWNVGGWLVTPIIQKLGFDGFSKMKQRVADEIKTTFKSEFHKTISLEQACEPDHIVEYVKAESGMKYLINPQL